MAKVTYLDPIDHLSGKIAKSYRTCYMHRMAATSRTEPNYTHVRNARKTAYSVSELEAQTKFGSVCKAARARLQDPAKIATDTKAFTQQTQYKTLYQYVWHQVANTIE